ncbi:MAG TPA: HipA family kinase [Polyangia bacterium]
MSSASRPPVPPAIRTTTAVRYLKPLREGGSLPAIVEADDGNLFVVKFRGAGQGTKALIAELLSAAVARALELPLPEPVIITIDPAMARTEPDEEVGDLLRASPGLNFALGYLPGAVMFTRGADSAPAPALASAIVWLDAYLMNVDRTVKNPNLLVQEGKLYLIDHGAALYWHHDWEPGTDRSGDRFALVRDHVLLPWAEELAAISAGLAARLTDEHIAAAVAALPEDWLIGTSGGTPAEQRAGYQTFLRKRRDQHDVFVTEAVDARARRL